MFVVKTLDYLPERSLSYDLNQLESESNVVTFLNSIVAFLIIEPIIYKTLHVTCLNLELILTKIVNLVVLLNLCFLKISQILLRDVFSFCLLRSDWKFYLHI